MIFFDNKKNDRMLLFKKGENRINVCDSFLSKNN